MRVHEDCAQSKGQNKSESVAFLDNSEYNENVVATDDYAKLLGQTIRAMEDRLAGMRSQRELMAAQMRDLDDQIAVTQQDIETAKTIWQRSPFSGAAIGETKPLANLGMTDAVEFVLSKLMLRLSPTDVRDKMVEWGYDFSTYKTDVVSSITTILRRFAEKGMAEEVKEGHRRKSYKWIGKRNERSRRVSCSENAHSGTEPAEGRGLADIGIDISESQPTIKGYRDETYKWISEAQK